MGILTDLIRNIVIFSLISYIIIELVPSDEYKKYINLFSGMAIILMFLNIIFSIKGENYLTQQFNQLIFCSEINDYNRIFEEYESKRQNELLNDYSSYIKSEISKIVENEGLVCNDIKLIYLTNKIDSNNIDNSFQINQIIMTISNKYSDEQGRIKDLYTNENNSIIDLKIINIKNRISQVYNLNIDNINVNK